MSTHTPHDALFRRVFSCKENAAGELRAVLPAALSAHIDWGSLRLDEGRFVDPELAERQSDVLFAAHIGDHEALVYLLLEHQSHVDPLMPLRLLRYMLRIWDRWLGDHPGAKRIPLIVPVVLYHGEHGAERWAAPRTMRALFDVDETVLDLVRPFVPGFELRLDELGCEPDEALRARAMHTLGLLTLLLLKHARSADDLLERLIALGEARGKAEGEALGVARAIVTVLEARGIAVPESARARILSCTDVPMLEGWLRRAATTSSAGEIVSEA